MLHYFLGVFFKTKYHLGLLAKYIVSLVSNPHACTQRHETEQQQAPHASSLSSLIAVKSTLETKICQKSLSKC